MDRDFVEPLEPLGLGDAVLNHYRIEILHIRNADQLVDIGVIALIALQVGMLSLPLLVRLPEEGDIQHIRLIRVNNVHLRPRDRRRDEMLLDRIGVNAVVDFRQLTLCRPSKHFLLFGLQPLELFDEIKLKFNRKP